MIIPSLLAKVRALWGASHAAGVPMVLVIVNDPASGIDAATFSRTVKACAIKAQSLVAPAWSLPAPVIVEMAHGDAKPAPAAPGGMVAVLANVAEIPDSPGDFGWHKALGSGDAFDGFVSTQGLTPSQWSEVLDHEITETLVDPMTDREATAPNGDVYPIEACDAVQAQADDDRVAVDVGDGGPPVMLSDFVLPAYFEAAVSVGPWDYLNRLSRPFSLAPGGYSAITKADGSQVQIFGARHSGVLSERAQHEASRVQIRARKARAKR